MNLSPEDCRSTEDEGPNAEAVFAAPWEAQVFAMVFVLHARGLFAWPEWSRMLADEAAHMQGSTTYDAWLAALERLLVERAITSPTMLAAWRAAWDRAARTTPHGQAIIVHDPPAAT